MDKMDNKTAHSICDAVGSRMTDLRRQYYDDTTQTKVTVQSASTPSAWKTSDSSGVWAFTGSFNSILIGKPARSQPQPRGSPNGVGLAA